MRSGGATCVVATRRVLIGGCFLHDPWVSRCFSVVWVLVFKLPSPFIFPISLFIALCSFLSVYSCDHSDSAPGIFFFQFVLHFFQRYVHSFFSFFLSLVICCEFLISLVFFFLFCDCHCSPVFWVLVFISCFLRFF